ncbi:SCO6745 family protein [Streptosporangium jomthongense]|uniref:SalK n=1 Tax=Streptosporangium jomthongense TaxID=1193683 RepID=A0ABV8FDU0_9ACTN
MNDLTRAMRAVLEPYHLVAVLAPQAGEAFRRLGLTGRWTPYFALRTAPLGEVSPAAVHALFHHFSPRMVEREVRAVRAETNPEAVLAARLAAADAGLRAILGEESVAAPELAEAAGLAGLAANACRDAPGRPLGSANAALPLPSRPHLALWQAATTLREHRGDGHFATLLHSGVEGPEALVLVVAAGADRRERLQGIREWTDEEWEAAERRLITRGLLEPDTRSLTTAGQALRRAVEERTDELAERPWATLGADATRRLHDLLAPVADRIIAHLGLPARPGAAHTREAPVDGSPRHREGAGRS